MDNILKNEIINMSIPGKIAFIFLLFNISIIIFKKNTIFDTLFSKLYNITRILIFGIGYICLLNWLCKNNFCWASYLLLFLNLIYSLLTLLLIISIITSIINFQDTCKNKIH